MEKKQKIILVFIVALVIICAGVYAYYANYKDTNIDEFTRGNAMNSHYGTALYAEAFLHQKGLETSLMGELMDVSVIDVNGNVVDTFQVNSGETHKVTGLKPGKYTVQYNYAGKYPYRPSTNTSEGIEIVSESKFKKIQQQEAEDREFRKEFYSIIYS